MSKFVAGCVACLLGAGPCFADKLGDGIYTWTEGGTPRVKRNDGAEVVLGKAVGKVFGTAAMHSVANDNSQYVLQLKDAGPLAEGAEKSYLALVIDGTILGVCSHSDRHADGTFDLNATVYGDDAAGKVADRLKIERQKRKNPGHKIEVRWSPEKEQYKAGEAVTLKMELRNAGDAPVSFTVGGKQRGPRDNQYRFLAYRGHGLGKAVPDTGDPLNFGGICGPKTLKPGETYTATVPLDKWFTFADPDTYRVTGVFELELVDPAVSFGEPLWNDLATGECSVKVVK
jgi:hypothetical protein